MGEQQNDVGRSLALLYDVLGGKISGGATIVDHEIPLTHEMGGQIFAEKCRSRFRLGSALAVAQSTAFSIIISSLPEQYRVQAWVVIVGATGRIADATISMETRDNTAGCPLWNWTSATGTERAARLAPGTDTFILVPDAASSAAMSCRGLTGSRIGPQEDDHVEEIVLRGNTLAFGAGTVDIFLRVWMLLFSRESSTMPFGAVAPFPSW